MLCKDEFGRILCIPIFLFMLMTRESSFNELHEGSPLTSHITSFSHVYDMLQGRQLFHHCRAQCRPYLARY